MDEDPDVWSLIARWGSVLRDPNDPFFDSGDLVCGSREYQLITTVDDESLLHPDYESFPCPECVITFTQLIDCETHYNLVHRHSCLQCSNSFPSAHLLDLHISENHDPFFAVSAEKNRRILAENSSNSVKNIYRCFLETCDRTFATSEERKNHASTVHDFAHDFRFPEVTKQRNKSSKVRPVSMITESSSSSNSPSSSSRTFGRSSKIPVRAFSYKDLAKQDSPTSSMWYHDKDQRSKPLNFDDMEGLKKSLPGIK